MYNGIGNKKNKSQSRDLCVYRSCLVWSAGRTGSCRADEIGADPASRCRIGFRISFLGGIGFIRPFFAGIAEKIYKERF